VLESVTTIEKRCASVPLSVRCGIFVPSAVAADITSNDYWLLVLTILYQPLPSLITWKVCAAVPWQGYCSMSAPGAVERLWSRFNAQ
jgi:hypothetical protein